MAKMKLDVKKIKGLLTSRFEILAVVVSGCLVAFCLVWGLSTYLSASSPEPEIRDSIKKVEQGRAGAPLPPKKNVKEKDDVLYGWPPVTDKVARLALDLPFAVGAAGSSGRANPRILALDSDSDGKSFQLDYLHKPIHTYDVNPSQEKIYAFPGNSSPTPVLIVAAKRLVVVSGTFPYMDQAESFRKALHVEKMEDLFTKGYAPTFEGLNVERRKISSKSGKEEVGPWEKLYYYDETTDKVFVLGKIEKLLKTAVIDDLQGEKYRDVIHGMSVTPLPKLAGKGAEAEYPEIRLPPVFKRLPQEAPEKKKDFGGPPKSGGGDHRPLGAPPPRMLPNATAKETLATSVSFSEMQEQSLKDQLAGSLNWFSPFGTPPEEPLKKPEDQKPAESKVGKISADVLEPIQNFKARRAPPVNHKALVRFVDVDLEPGAIYQYRVQVRLANPNYKQPAAVLAHSGLAEIKELVSEWAETPTIAIPSDADFKFYITHQERGFVTKVSSKQSISYQNNAAIADRYVPFQVFRFLDVVREKGKDHYVADWVVAERLLVARGEPIGRECDVELAEWTKLKSQWELGGISGAKATGVTVDFRAEPATVLLDFTGGTQFYKNPKTNAPTAAEESETEALLLMPDMTMRLRNSREDNDELNSPLAQERHAMFDAWKTRLEELRPQPKAPPGKGDKGGR